VLETLPIDDAWKANFATDAGASARANMVDGKFTEERQKLHRKILREAFKGVKKPDGQPAVYFLGGGAASGKSTAIEDGSLGVPTADSGLAVHIDPDALKEELPEYQEMSRALDTGAAAFVHEESSYLANSIAAIAREAGYNVVLDGVNSSMKVADKIEDYRELGYKVEGHYVTRPTAEAVNNNQGRFDRAVAKLEAGDENVFPRYVPADRVIAGHEEVSKNFESLAPLFDRATLTDMTGNQRTTVGETTYGQPFTPMAEAAPLYQSFLAKGN
jgi:predicted ABC-type ATPase